MQPDRLLTMRDLAEYLGVSHTWVKQQVAARRLPHTRIGHQVRFTADHVAEIIAAGEQPIRLDTTPPGTPPPGYPPSQPPNPAGPQQPPRHLRRIA